MKILLVILIVLPLSSLAQSLDSIDISRHIHPIEEVVVTGSNVKPKISVLSSALTIIERKSIDNDNRPSLLPTLSEQVPGLFITARGVMGYGVSTGAAGGMSIRGIGGSPTTGVMVLIDGHPQHMGLMGHPIADTYQSILAERVEVVRGPASALYGSNAMGGVINIVTDRALQHGSRTKLHAGYGSFNTLQTNLTNQIHKKAFSSTATISYNRSDGHRKDMAFEQYSGSLRIGLELSQNWDAMANTNITHFNASNPGAITAPIIDNDSHITRTTSAISINNNFTRTQGSISLYYNWGQHKINDGYSAGSQPLNYRFHSHDRVAGASIYQNFSTSDKGTVTIGLDYQYAGGQAANHYIDSGEDKLIAKKHMHNSAAYINLNQTILQWLRFNAALRCDYNSRVGDEWIPQVSASVLLPHKMEIRALISKGFRFPTIREMYMFPSQNPNLRSEQIINYELSLRQNIKTINYGINIYYIDGKDIIQTLIVDSRPQNINTAKISNFGIETDITWQATKKWQVAANYSYINMKYPILATPKHKLFIMTRYAYKRWSIGSSIQLIDGLITELEPIQQESYTLWNADIQFSASNKTSIYIRAENLLGTKYEINVGYPMPGITINVGVKFTI